MPGMVGLLTRMPRRQAEAELAQMVEALCHEPFYQTGTWIDESLGVYVGWVARKGSFAERMPVQNEQGDVVLVFSGEEFPQPGTAGDLKRRGHRLDPDGPSYLVHLYEEHAGFPANLNGRFHGLVADRRRGRATLFNDRYGMHRLYCHESKDAFYFAAEAKALLAIRPELRRIDAQGLAEVVACGCVMGDRTLFHGIRLLPGASAWDFRRGMLDQRGTYFRCTEWEDQAPLDEERFYAALRDTFSRNLPRYFDDREPIAMSLTGGLDTRMIMAWYHAAPRSLPCYTFGGMYRECRDVRVARRVAGVSGQSYEVIPVGREFLSSFPRYAERTVYLTDGCLSVSHAPDLFVNERAREIAAVRMTGNYGSEVLRRGVAFKPEPPLAGLYAPELRSRAAMAEETYRSLRREHPLTFAVFRQAPWHHYGLLALEQTQVELRSPFLDNDIVRTVFRAPESAVTSDATCLRLIADGSAALARIPTDRGVGGRQGRLGAAVARGVAEFSRKAEYAYDYGMPAWLARVDQRLRGVHPERLFLGRHKFSHFRVWYRDVLNSYVREMLLDARTLARPYVERKMVEAIVRDHIEGVRNYTSEIHTLLTLELLHRRFVDAA
jgi:asparagine synthase (glutamine-hydrolysing)